MPLESNLENKSENKKTKLYLRFSTAKDVDVIQRFYKNNEHEYVATRDENVLNDLIKNGAVTLIETEKADVVAVSVSYPVTVLGDDGLENHKWTEMGSTRISLSGLGLFDVLSSAQVVHAFLFEPPEECFVVEIDKANAHSHHVFKKMGCEAFDVPDEMRKAADMSMIPEDRGAPVDWYQLTVDKVPQLARKLLNRMDNPVIENKKTGDIYEIDFSRCHLSTFISQLRKIAGVSQEKARHITKDKGMLHIRDKFKKHL